MNLRTKHGPLAAKAERVRLSHARRPWPARPLGALPSGNDEIGSPSARALLDSLRFLGAKIASYGPVKQEPDFEAPVYTES